MNDKNKRFLFFLLRFFGVYAGLSLVYAGYLRWWNPDASQLDAFSVQVGEWASELTSIFGLQVAYFPTSTEPSYTFAVAADSVARMVEGCNSISVIILFWAFLIAFKGTWKRTIAFGVIGSFVVLLMNVLRISILIYALKTYPEHSHLLHGVVFPAIIYGTVFLLWVLWVNKFADYAKEIPA